MTNFVLTAILLLAGIVFGGLLGFWGLLGVAWIVAQGVEDQTGLGWIWILLFVTVPIGSIAGGFCGVLVSNKFKKRRKLNKAIVSNDE